MHAVPDNVVELSTKFFRPETKTREQPMNFVIGQGGLGDYIGYMSAIKFIAENCPNVLGHLYCIKWFMEIAENILAPYEKWTVHETKELTKKHLAKRPTFGPSPIPIGRHGAHAVDLGFIYYLNQNTAQPDYDCYPELDLSVLAELALPEKDFVVMTPVSSNEPKTMRAVTFNGIKDWLIEKGIVPIFLGQPSFREGKVSINPDFDFSGGISLLGETTLLACAGIMSRAKAVVGLDNGLLHLAATTEVPILYGYTISSPEHTRPRRKKGKTHDIYPDPQTLSCTFCQSNMRLFANHDFRYCLYGDTKCLDVISDPKYWTDALEKIIFG